MGKKVVISGYYGYGNFGDEAILGVLINHLKLIDAQITVISGDPQYTSEVYDVNTVKTFDILGIISAISSADILISGGGSLLQDVTSLKSLLYYSFVIKMAEILNKQVIIFAQGIGPLQRQFSKKLVIDLLSRASLVTVRDSKSQNVLQEFGIDAKLVTDPMFSVDLPLSEKNGAVGVQLRAFKSVDDEFLKLLAQQIVLHFLDRKIELYVFQESMDLDICKRFEKILKKVYAPINVEIVHLISNNDIIMRISQLEYMIAMRFHAILIALKTGVKPLAINYDAKVAKLAYEAFLPMIPISPTGDYADAFDKLIKLDVKSLMEYSINQHFDWSIYDSMLK